MSYRKSTLGQTFESLKQRGEKALITFITAGDPDLKTTERLIIELSRSGADVIELGIPFSDPMADGPTIQAASERALKGHTTPDKVLATLSRARKHTNVPVVLFGYYNPVLQYGLRRFADDCAKAGADGVLIVDLPPEEAEELKAELDRVGLDLIFLLTPTSDEGRMKLVAKRASGFIYYVSIAGVTGARAKLPTDVSAQVKLLKRHTKLPVGVGFGISTPEQAKSISRCADGVVVGSALVTEIAKHRTTNAAIKGASEFVSRLKKGIANQ